MKPGPAPRRAWISLAGTPVGTLEETPNGTRFAYLDVWVSNPSNPPISLTMPVRAAPYETGGLLPFFENLLPEGWLLEIATEKLKIAKDDAFGLLLATCADCVGAVEVAAEPAS